MLNEFSKLQKHLSADLFNCDISGDTLHIIDDYNIDSNMSEEMLLKFVDAISNVCQIKYVKIYIQKKHSNQSIEDVLFHFQLLQKSGNVRKLKDNCRKKLQFIEAFKEKGIQCSYLVYPKFKVKPPFHGRYWLSMTSGFIVDGSINTAQNKMVLAQVMDEENYALIRVMTKNIIDCNEHTMDEYDQTKLENLYGSLDQLS